MRNLQFLSISAKVPVPLLRLGGQLRGRFNKPLEVY